MKIDSTVALNDGNSIPMLGFGTYRMDGDVAYQSTLHALKAGYRHIDTAQYYANEAEVGKAIKDSGIPREEIFVTSKVEISNFGYDNTIKSIDQSLEKLGYDYFDLFILHFPVENYRIESYKALEEVKSKGKVKSIGVSNFTIEHLSELIDSVSEVPTVNQVELSPFLSQNELRDYSESKDIKIEAYSPLTQGNRLDDDKLVAIAQKYNKSTAQILIKWNQQNDIIVLPKSSKFERIEENADIFDFEISTEDMQSLNSMNEDARYSWNPEDERQVKTFSNSIVRKLSKLKKNL